MTAEIVIMNKAAVALAADSAVTMEQDGGHKIYNTVNKLFALSKYHPVGVMVYGNAELMGVPWETIIKSYRASIKTKRFGRLVQYAEDFIAFLGRSRALFPAAQQRESFEARVVGLYLHLRDEIEKAAQAVITAKGAITPNESRKLVTETVNKHHARWSATADLAGLPKNFGATLRARYAAEVKRAKKYAFEKLPMTAATSNKLTQLASHIFTKQMWPMDVSGVVVAGFGEAQIFPSYASYIVDAVIDNRVRCLQEGVSSISFHHSAIVRPFAQSEMVATFMEGIDPALQQAMDGYLTRLFGDYAQELMKQIPALAKLSSAQKKSAAARLNTLSKLLLKEFTNSMQTYRRERHIDPVIDAVSGLPIDELAAMAESLVNLTSFKRRVSMELETVGGAVDVAVISKGDGFIWIKRKHYFEPGPNPQFFANYYRD